MGWPATGFICARTDGDEKLYLPHRQPSPSRQVRLRRRTIDGVAVEIVGLFVSSPDENLAAGGRLQRDETVIKMARVGGLNYR